MSDRSGSWLQNALDARRGNADAYTPSINGARGRRAHLIPQCPICLRVRRARKDAVKRP